MVVKTKICKDCQLELPIDKFGSYSKKYSDGSASRYIQGICRKCVYQRRKNNPYYAEKNKLYKISRSIAKHHREVERKKSVLLEVRTTIKRYFNSEVFKAKKRKLNEN